MNTNNTIKQSYAKASLNYNMKNTEFVELFSEKFASLGINLEELSRSSI